MNTPTVHPQWSSRLAFVLAATGSAVGLGNIWKFPYVVGENGGGAFVLVYLACIFLMGIPILMAESMLGRLGRRSPVATMQHLVTEQKAFKGWALIGWNGVLASALVLSFYAVIGGWSLAYVVHALSGDFTLDPASTEPAIAVIGGIFSDLLANPLELLLWHSLFMLIVIGIVGRGVRQGLERSITWLMPMLFILLLVLVGYAMTTGEFMRGVTFLFRPNFADLSGQAMLAALGHAAFTLSIGIGVMMAYGSYLPDSVNIPRTVISIALLDVVVALLAGLAIFPIVFAEGLQVGEGPGLIFVTLPLAFAQMGDWVAGLNVSLMVASLFFLLLAIAAITSAISMLEPVVEWLEEQKGLSRLSGTLLGGGVIWFVGIATLLSFNLWDEFYPLAALGIERTFFQLFDFLVSNLMMPLGGLAIVLFAGWVIPRATLEQQLPVSQTAFNLLYLLLRWITPAGVALVFFYQLIR